MFGPVVLVQSRMCSVLFHNTQHFDQGFTETRHFLVGAHAYAHPAVRADGADEHTTLEQFVEDAVAIVEMTAEQNEVGLRLGHFERLALVGLFLEPCRGLIAGVTQMRHTAELFVGMFERGKRGCLGDGRQVVRHTHDAHTVDNALLAAR